MVRRKFDSKIKTVGVFFGIWMHSRAAHRGCNPSIFDGPQKNWGAQRGPKRLEGGPKSLQNAKMQKKVRKRKERKKGGEEDR